MCLSPIIIRNRSRRYVDGYHRPFLRVPCGHCPECQSRNQDDWFIRSVYETKRVQEKGGAVWFATFTFDDEHLHWYEDRKRKFRCPCFDPDDFKQFRDMLRTNMKRDMKKGLIPENSLKDENTIRYFYACEYGGKKGRIHLHANIYIPFYLSCKYVYDLFKKCWTNGFVMWSKKGMIATGNRASNYIMKYMSKEQSWIEKYGINDYIAQLKKEIYFKSIDSSYKTQNYETDAEDRLREFRHVIPGHKQSLGFGVDGINYFKKDDGSWDIDKLIENKMSKSSIAPDTVKNGQVDFKLNVPMYYLRKIFYNVDEWKLYRLSEFGKEMLAMRYELSLKRTCERYDPYFQSFEVFRIHVHSIEPNSNFTLLGCWEKMQDIMKQCGRTLYDLAVYDTVYRGIVGTLENEPLISNPREFTYRSQLDFLNDNSLDFILQAKDFDFDPDDPSARPVVSVCRDDRGNPITFDDLPCYSGFNYILDTIQYYENELGSLRHDAKMFKKMQDERISDFIDEQKQGAYTSDFLFQTL